MQQTGRSLHGEHAHEKRRGLGIRQLAKTSPRVVYPPARSPCPPAAPTPTQIKLLGGILLTHPPSSAHITPVVLSDQDPSRRGRSIAPRGDRPPARSPWPPPAPARDRSPAAAPPCRAACSRAVSRQGFRASPHLAAQPAVVLLSIQAGTEVAMPAMQPPESVVRQPEWLCFTAIFELADPTHGLSH